MESTPQCAACQLHSLCEGVFESQPKQSEAEAMSGVKHGFRAPWFQEHLAEVVKKIPQEVPVSSIQEEIADLDSM